MSSVRLLWLATGSGDVQLQALYSLYSALAFKTDADVSLQVYTDAPSVYQPLAKVVGIQEVTHEKLELMCGAARLPFRMKLALLVEALRIDSQSPVVFIDADTFFFRNFEPLLQQIDPRNAVMHIREWHVASASIGQLRRFRRNMQQVRYQGATVNLNVYMWNSGVIGLHPACVGVLEEALSFCDAVWSQYSKPFVEQFAVASFLQKANIVLHPAADYIFHYWYQKPEYQRAIADLLLRWKNLPVERALQELRQNRIVLPPPPRKLSILERLSQRLSGKAIPDVRGLP